MDRSTIIAKVRKKLSGEKPHPAHSGEDEKFKELTPENAIAYTRLCEDYHNFKVPAHPKTYKKKECGSDMIFVELEGKDRSDWHPVWMDDKKGHLYGEY